MLGTKPPMSCSVPFALIEKTRTLNLSAPGIESDQIAGDAAGQTR